jgi:hypothetical protein
MRGGRHFLAILFADKVETMNKEITVANASSFPSYLSDYKQLERLHV